MRVRNRLSPDEWAARLDSLMHSVLSAPDRYPPATLVWARWRRTWLAERGSLFRDPAPWVEVAEGEGFAGPSCEPPPAGVSHCTIALAAAPKIGCHSPVVAPSSPAIAAGSSTSAHSILSLTGDNRSAREAGNGARAGGAWRWSGDKTFATQNVLW